MSPLLDPAPPRSPELVLLLDADVHAAQIMREAIQLDPDGGARQVLHCSTAREALSALADRQPDLIITNLDLPDLSGARLLRLLKERARAAPVIATVDHPSLEIGVAAVRGGAADVLRRPVHPLRLA